MPVGIRAGHADDAHHVAVAVTEEGQGAVAHGVGVGGLPSGYGQVGADFLVGQALHGQLLVGGHRAHVVEVETQPSGVAQGAGLPHVGAEDGTQRGVEQVGAAVVAGGVQTTFRLNLGGYGVAQGNVAVGHRAPMDDEAGDGALRVLHLHAPVGAAMMPRSPTCPPPSA